MAEKRKPKVFILGISGFLGHQLALRLQPDFLVSGACFSNFVTIPNAQTYPVDIAKVEVLEAILRVQSPDFIVNCMGVADRNVVNTMPKLTDSLNVLLPVSYAVLANKMRTQFLQISTAEIYDGEEGPYKEEDTHFSMLDPFSKQKVAAESYIRAQTLESNILRVGQVLGLGTPYRRNYLDRFRAKLSAKKNLECSVKSVRSYLSVESFALAVREFLLGPFPGKHRVFHVGGVNISEFALMAAYAEMTVGNSNLVKPLPDDEEKNHGLISDQFARAYPKWQPETTGTLLLNLLKEQCPGVGAKKWQKTLQTR